MTSSSSLYGNTPNSTGNVSSANLTTLYNANTVTVPSNGNLVVPGTLTVNGCAILSDCTTFTLLPTSTTINMGSSSGKVNVLGYVTADFFTAGGFVVYDASGPFTTSTTAADQVASTTPAATVRSLKYQYQITSGTAYQAVEIMIIHDGSTAYLNTYSDVRTGANLSTFNADISGGFIRLLVTPTNAITTYKGSVIAIGV